MRILKNFTGSLVTITIVALIFFICACMDISNNHFRTVSNEIAEQNAQTITTNIEQGNSYYLNTVGYIVEDKSTKFVLNESTENGIKNIPVNLTSDQVDTIEYKNNDKTYNIGILAKVVDANSNIEVVSATTDKDIVNELKTERLVLGITTLVALSLSIASILAHGKEFN